MTAAPDPAFATGLPPLVAPGARVLVLGSMPGRASLAARQYYAHPRNAFWPILGALLGFPANAPYAERVARAVAAGIAIWDVVHACQRPGSLDADIDPASVQVNDFTALLGTHPGITRICFNGGAAAALFTRHVLRPDRLQHPPETRRLPSTSPAHAALDFAAKLACWQAALEDRIAR